MSFALDLSMCVVDVSADHQFWLDSPHCLEQSRASIPTIYMPKRRTVTDDNVGTTGYVLVRRVACFKEKL